MQQSTPRSRNEISFMLKQASDYLNLGLDVIFNEEISEDQSNFLNILKYLLEDLMEVAQSEKYTNHFTEGLYQAESLARLAANVIFLEVETGDKVNYLSMLRKLLSEVREAYEESMLELV